MRSSGSTSRTNSVTDDRSSSGRRGLDDRLTCLVSVTRGPSWMGSSAFLRRPTLCSPVIVPPSEMASSMISVNASATCSFAVSSVASKTMVGCVTLFQRREPPRHNHALRDDGGDRARGDLSRSTDVARNLRLVTRAALANVYPHRTWPFSPAAIVPRSRSSRSGIESKAQNPRDTVATRIFIQGFIGWLQTVGNETSFS